MRSLPSKPYASAVGGRCKFPRRLAAATFLTALTVLTRLTVLTADRIDQVDVVGSGIPGASATAKQPYALDGTFRGWWMILLRSLYGDCFWNQQRHPSRTTASRTLRAASAFIRVHQRSDFFMSLYECSSAVQSCVTILSSKPVFLPNANRVLCLSAAPSSPIWVLA